ncbi:DUF1681-domain-containing protein [Canariomyces notabilis]|uniref:DUF1681-domain-containing protein n=1 Tax=Canariomyces notabilis TaxID=2074819 RepID=A0AAN6TDG5_9PEZI|nr:DUF1681-domain-containing protein [Canariomyces arenarius]
MDSSTEILDPATGRPLPSDAIVRVLHVTHPVHVYAIPPGTLSTKAGYAAASWTADPRNHIFTARLRVLETSYTTSGTTTTSSSTNDDDSEQTVIKTNVLLEDPTSGALFAAAPYTSSAAVEPCSDSSRFFALRVQDPSTGRKATLGVGFEERSDAFDFGVVLQEALRVSSGNSTSAGAKPTSAPSRKGLMDDGPSSSSGKGRSRSDGRDDNDGGGGGGGNGEKKDLSLKEGETITINLKGTRFGRRAAGPGDGGRQQQQGGKEEAAADGRSLASFALPPPPGSNTATTAGTGGGAFLPPPPSAREVRAQKRLSAQDLGFDDGQFGEFA